jgi:hypothetical protein
MSINMTAYLLVAEFSGQAAVSDLSSGNSTQENLSSGNEIQADADTDELDAYKVAVLLLVGAVIFSLYL